MSATQSFLDRCCNPLKKIHHKCKSRDLRTISPNLQKRFPSILPDAKVCGLCRKEAACSGEKPPIDAQDDSSGHVSLKVLISYFRLLKRSFLHE